MSDDEKAHLVRLEDKLDDIIETQTNIREDVATLKAHPVCNTPNLCGGLQNVLSDHERRLANLEAVRNWMLGVCASVSLIGFLCWDLFKVWLKR